MKYLQPYIIIVGAVVVMLWAIEYRARGVAEALADVRADSLRTATATWADERTSLTEAEALLRDRADSLISANLLLTSRYYRLSAQRYHLSDSLNQLLALVQDSAVVSDLTGIFDTLRATVEACDVSLSVCQEVNVILESRLTLMRSADTATQALLTATREQLEAEQRRAQPGTLTTLWRAAPAIATAFIMGLVLGR